MVTARRFRLNTLRRVRDVDWANAAAWLLHYLQGLVLGACLASFLIVLAEWRSDHVAFVGRFALGFVGVGALTHAWRWWRYGA